MQGLLVKILSVGSVCRMRWFVPGCRAVESAGHAGFLFARRPSYSAATSFFSVTQDGLGFPPGVICADPVFPILPRTLLVGVHPVFPSPCVITRLAYILPQ